MTRRWQGNLWRSDTGITGFLSDDLGNEIALTGTPDGTSYRIVGVPGPIPAWLALPGDDEYLPDYEGWP